MSAEHLSQEEIDALLRGEGPPAEGTAEWEALRPPAAAALRRVWGDAQALLGTPAEVGDVELREQSADEVRLLLGDGAVWARLPVDGGAATVWLALERDLALSLVAAALGAEVQAELGAAGGSALAEILAQLPARALGDVLAEAGWAAPVGAVEVLGEGQAPDLPERAVALWYAVEVGPARGRMALLLPVAVGRRLLAGLAPGQAGPAPGAVAAGTAAGGPPAGGAAGYGASRPPDPGVRGDPAGAGPAPAAAAGAGRAPGAAAGPVPADPGPPVGYRPAQFAELAPAGAGTTSRNLDLLLDVTLQVTVELGRTKRQIRDVLELGPGSIIELEKLAGEPVDVLVNGRRIARGEVVVVDEHFAVRITDIVSPAERAGSLGR